MKLYSDCDQNHRIIRNFEVLLLVSPVQSFGLLHPLSPQEGEAVGPSAQISHETLSPNRATARPLTPARSGTTAHLQTHSQEAPASPLHLVEPPAPIRSLTHPKGVLSVPDLQDKADRRFPAGTSTTEGRLLGTADSISQLCSPATLPGYLSGSGFTLLSVCGLNYVPPKNMWAS